MFHGKYEKYAGMVIKPIPIGHISSTSYENLVRLGNICSCYILYMYFTLIGLEVF